MNIVLGASGQVGSAIVDFLLKEKAPVTAVVHNKDKAERLEQKGARVAVVDLFDRESLQAAFRDGDTVFVLTPETGKSDDVIGHTKTILANYRAAVQASSITKVVGLSSIGAQYPVGNLEMSYLLERAFIGADVQSVFVRPAYFYSNWLSFIETAKKEGTLPTFYPIDLKISMSSPLDVAEFVAGLMTQKVERSPIYELEGPAWYSSNDVAATLSKVLGRDVEAQQIPREKWDEQLHQIGFTEDAIKNFVAMTELVADGKAQPERQGTLSSKTKTTLDEYLSQNAVAKEDTAT